MFFPTLPSYAVPVSLGFLILTGLLLRFVPARRRSALVTLIFFAVCLGGVGLSHWVARLGFPDFAEWLWLAAVFGLGAALIRQSTIAFFSGVLPRLRLMTPHILQDLVAALCYVLWAFVLLSENNYDVKSLIATSAVATAVIAFSLQDTLGNILGGMALQLDRTLAAGDWIQFEDVSGRVVDVSWRCVSVETRNWETVVIPNSQLLKNKFLVLGRRDGQPIQWRRWVRFNVDFRHSPARVIEAVNAALRSVPIENMAEKPPPNCILQGFEESYGKYAVRYWLTDLAEDDPTDSEIRTHLYFALKRAGIGLSIPAHAVFLTEETRKRKRGKEKRDLEHRLEALSHVALFERLQPEEKAELAERLVPTPFAPGDIMTRMSAEAHWLYIIHSGRADVVVNDPRGHSARVAQLGPGTCFGEMGLLTGEPRTATVVARSEVDCYKLDKESFRRVIESRPQVAEELSRLLAERRMELDSALENLDAAARAERLAHAESDILSKIRSFFGLQA